MSRPDYATLFSTIADEAAGESVLWSRALLTADRRRPVPVFSPLGDPRHALAVETIYEGYLLHYGRPRLFGPDDAATSVLLGDYLYAHGLVRLAARGSADAVGDLADLISLCTQVRATGPRPGGARLDGAVWAGTATLLGRRDERLERARAALRLESDPGPLGSLARDVAGAGAVERALSAHAAMVE